MINKNFNFGNLEKKAMRPLSDFIEFSNFGNETFDQVEERLGEFNNTNSKTTKIGFFGKKDYYDKRLYSLSGKIPTIVTNNNPFFLIFGDMQESQRKKVIDGTKALKFDKEENGTFVCNDINSREYTGFKSISPTLVARDFKGPKSVAKKTEKEIYIRKLMPIECFRLMGFDDESFNKAKNIGASDSQLYKQAGNSIIVNVAMSILKELHGDTTKDINVFELCSGIGAFSLAYKKLGYNYNCVGYSEIDKYAEISFNAIHGVTNKKNYGDMSKITNIYDDVDVLIGGTPCQDYSKAGKGLGGDKGSGTRSSLIHEQSRIAIQNGVKVVIWENVANVMSGKHKHNVDQYLSDLEAAGYDNNICMLNGVDFGIPQSRKRIFIVSILKGESWI